MQVGASTSSIPLLPVTVNPRRDDSAERLAEQRRQQVQALDSGSQQQTPQPEVTRIRVRPTAEAQAASEQAQEAFKDLPTRERSALQSYLDNGPSIQERLGVELAGIDTYA